MKGSELYDDPVFLAGYQALRSDKRGLNDELEIPAMAALLPPVDGLRAAAPGDPPAAAGLAARRGTAVTPD